jgi:NADPH:quinone reductase-like Zn-dependent oxidoreductase
VLVAVAVSSVNPADRYISQPLPQVLGSDLAGTVIAVEDSCQRLRVGDRVWADIGAVTETSDGKGKENGAYAQIAVALESQLGFMPRNLDFTEAGVLPKVSLTSYKALQWYGGAPYHDREVTVLMLGGSGGTGTTGIQMAKAWGATTVITTTSQANADYVTSLGADRVIDYHTQNWWDESVVANNSVDVIYDAVGQSGTGDRAMPKLRTGGFYVSLRGQMPSQPRDDVSSNFFINSDTNLDNVELLDSIRDLVQADQLHMRSITQYSLFNITGAFQESSMGHVNGKIAVFIPVVSDVVV